MIPELRDALHVDGETRSRINLRKTGPYVYFEDWSTDVWTVCFARGDEPVEAWHPGDPVPETVIKAAEDGVPFVAHNVGFERVMFKYTMGPRYGWPQPPLRQWRCTAAMAAAQALPRDLERAALVVGCRQQKDMAGSELMKQMMKPWKIEKVPCWLCGEKSCEHDEQFRLKLHFKETPEMIARGTTYCRQDVETERDLCNYLRPLSPIEQEIWFLDQMINERGVLIDLPAVANARHIVDTEVARLNSEIEVITNNWLAKATQTQKLRIWCSFEGLNVANLRRDTIRDILLDETNLDERIREALELRREAGKSSTAKLKAFEQRACADGRMRDNLMYCGAGTGRWSGRGAQLQNMPSRFTLHKLQKIRGAELIRAGATPDEIRYGCWDSPLEIVSASLRGMIIAAPGHEFTVGDYSAIEARGTAWLAGATGMLDTFASKQCAYRRQAGLIYGIDPEEAQKLAKDSFERGLGKIAVLGLGYQMGKDKFISSCWKERIAISMTESDKIVTSYREGNPEIPALWDNMEKAAFCAVDDPGTVYEVSGGKIKFLRQGEWLMMQLPGGRILWYAHPRIKLKQMPWRDEKTGLPAKRWGVVYHGMNSVTHQWGEQNAYGGKWTENAVQALSRDILAEAMLRLEAHGYPQVLSVHDESVSEHVEGFGSVEEYEQLMCVKPAWAEGFPIEAEVWRGKEYRK